MTSGGLQPGWGRYGGVPVSPVQNLTIRQGAEQGLSLDRLQAALASQGIPLRRQAIADVRREITGSVARVPTVRNIRDDFRPTSRSITETQLVQKTTFRVFGEIRIRDPLNGEFKIMPVNFGTNELMTIGEMKLHIDEIMEGIIDRYEWERESLVISEIRTGITQ